MKDQRAGAAVVFVATAKLGVEEDDVEQDVASPRCVRLSSAVW